jgi:hypothetical protein
VEFMGGHLSTFEAHARGATSFELGRNRSRMFKMCSNMLEIGRSRSRAYNEQMQKSF